MRPAVPAIFTLMLILSRATPSSNASDPNLTAVLANGKIQLTWPSEFSHYFLLEASEPVPGAWHELVAATVVSNSTVRVTLDPIGSSRFFQLLSGKALFDGSSLDAFRGYQQSDFPSAS